MMGESEMVALERDVEASIVPSGTRVTLQKGETATITQSLGGTYTVVLNGNMFRIDAKDADALGKEPEQTPTQKASKPETEEDLEKQVWDQMKTCYDPEIPVNVVDLGLIYDCHIEELEPGSHKASVKMTLTAPGCGMGPVIAEDAKSKMCDVPGVGEANVELVWDPPWDQGMISEEGKMQLGLI